MVVQPFYRCTVFLSSAFYNPDNNVRALAGCVCDQLAEVIVVGILQLILDDDPALGASLCCENIHIEITNLGFGFIDGDLQSDRVCTAVPFGVLDSIQ